MMGGHGGPGHQGGSTSYRGSGGRSHQLPLASRGSGGLSQKLPAQHGEARSHALLAGAACWRCSHISMTMQQQASAPLSQCIRTPAECLVLKARWKRAVPYKAFQEAVEDRVSSWRGSMKEGCGCIMHRQTMQERYPSCGCGHTTAQQATGLGIEAPGEAVQIRSRPVLAQLNCLS